MTGLFSVGAFFFFVGHASWVIAQNHPHQKRLRCFTCRLHDERKDWRRMVFQPPKNGKGGFKRQPFIFPWTVCVFIFFFGGGVGWWELTIFQFLGGGFKYFLFSPLLGEMIQFDEHIFQMGWFNHQPDFF